MISRQEVEHVARLARLHFEDEELTRLQPELSQIIEEHFGVELTSGDVAEISTVGDAIALVAERA